ncbi:MAG TPA: DUF6390 family protein [Thermomicrobiales bacterium]|nr:DUF6390 family protein [Thermomicrobiales bacterium]
MPEVLDLTAAPGAPERAVAGTRRFISYAFMPNRLHYCGGDHNHAIFDYALAAVREPPLDAMLRKFTGAMPYLALIARANGLADPFDDRVVEAYWVGNDLLERVEVRDLYGSLRERYRKQLPPKLLDLVASKAPAGARPHHSFHVFDVWRTVDHLDGNVLATLDNCRISWGTVRAVEGAEVVVDRRPVVLREGRLALGEPRPERATRLIEGKGFATAVAPGDQVSMHWGWVCETLDGRQARALERYTRHHLALANTTI